jgi:hypothetical protein
MAEGGVDPLDGEWLRVPVLDERVPYLAGGGTHLPQACQAALRGSVTFRGCIELLSMAEPTTGEELGGVGRRRQVLVRDAVVVLDAVDEVEERLEVRGVGVSSVR